MGNGFDFTFVKKKCRFDQGFAVTGGAGKSNFCIFRKKAVNLLDGVDGGFQRVSVVTAVEGIKKSSVFAYQRGFCCGRAGKIRSYKRKGVVLMPEFPQIAEDRKTLLKIRWKPMRD